MVVAEEPHGVDELLILLGEVDGHHFFLVDLQLLEFYLANRRGSFYLGRDLEVELPVDGGTIADSAEFGLKGEGNQLDL
jgi:hypothetical protein